MTKAKDDMKMNLSRLAGQLGMLLCLAGFVAMFLGWNGAASFPGLPQQFPYMISGGIVGLSLVVLGSALLIVQNQRADRVRVEAAIERLATAIEKQSADPHTLDGLNSEDYVLAGTASYHRLDCHLPEANDDAHLLRLDQVAPELSPCRVCTPPEIGQPAGTV